ncbi:hypothetical protein GWK91_09105 [Virgibacillus sp. MSP4-1]|uniref:hypothetical protein n=1 Tax=Virgibacillus sp. MSP4-1 TaxID=2700081 RepID=UPI0003A3EC76|nr:hypothetical protein [Virgibacillus sp. MSP4-1]QHS23096.1 hypothetical protein GWK91_09105 [Virgibacillus sp. MSP4-1]
MNISGAKSLLLIVSFVPFISLSHHDNILQEIQTKNIPVEENRTSSTQEKKEEADDLTHEQIKGLTEKFMDILVQETNQEYRVLSYNSKEQLVQELKSIASLSLAKKYVDLYYKERNQQLYIIPTETPPWFLPEEPYDIQTENGQATIVQANSSELYGNYKIRIEFKYKEQKGWIIHNVYYP